MRGRRNRVQEAPSRELLPLSRGNGCDTMICCVCGEEFEGHGNNPDPIPHREGERCCDVCNALYVIPIRMMKRYEESII